MMAVLPSCRCNMHPLQLQLVWLLSLLFITVTADDNVDLQNCFNALEQADTNGDGKIDADEHLLFLQIFGPTDYWIQLQERPLELKAKFNAVACMCIQRGGPLSCCHGDSASIDISGIYNDTNSVEREYLETVCILTQRAIDQVERERLEMPREEETISVWLRTSYQVAIVQGNSQSQEELLQDLGTAMNQLVEEVLDEELRDERHLRQERRVQEVEYLPTRLESTPTTCQVNMPPQNTCVQIDTTTYVVGPQDKLNQAEMETALMDAIDSGRLQELVDEVNPDSYLRIMDEIPEEVPVTSTVPPPTDAPPQEPINEEPINEEPSTTPLEDNGHDWSTGAITGLVLAGVGIIALAAGLTYGRQRVLNKREDSKQQLYASQQGSLINMELLNNELEHDLDDLEKGNGGGGIVEGSEMPSDSMRRLSYKMDQVGLEKFQDDALPEPPPPEDSNLIIVPFAGKRPQSTKEPSEGDLGASNNIHLDSLNSSTAFTLTDRKASSGSIGTKTPVNYNAAMGLVEEGSDDSSYSSSSSSSSESDSDISSDDDVSHLSSSSSESSEYDEYRDMKAQAYEARLAEARSSIKGRALEEIVITQDAPVEPNNVGIIAGATVGAAALGGAAVYAATRDTDNTNEVIDETEEGEVNGREVSQPPLAQRSKAVAGESHDGGDAPSVVQSSAATAPAAPGGLGPGAIVGITSGAVGAVALGGVAVIAATRKDDSDEEETSQATRDLDSPPPQMQSESGINNGEAVERVDVAAVGATSFATIQDPVAVGEESQYQMEHDVSKSYSSSVTISVEEQAVVDEGSQMIEDPVAVGEESLVIENESSVSAYSSGNIDSISPLSAPKPFVSDNISPSMDSDSGHTPECSYNQVEDSALVRPPPRPPSPSDKGPSLAAAVALGAGVVGVGATAAYLASRDQEEHVSESEGDSSSESEDEVTTDSESEEGSSDSQSDEETSTTASQIESNLAPTSSVPPGDERIRPPPSETEIPTSAYLAARQSEDEANTDSESEEDSSDSQSDEETSTTASQIESNLVPARSAPSGDERIRPPPSGTESPYLATSHQEEDVSESEDDSSSGSEDEATFDSESDEASSDSESDEENSTTASQIESNLVPTSSVPPGDERIRPPASGTENPYYAAAAAMAIGGGAAAGAVYDFEESESSTISHEQSTVDSQVGCEYNASMEEENMNTESERPTSKVGIEAQAADLAPYTNMTASRSIESVTDGEAKREISSKSSVENDAGEVNDTRVPPEGAVYDFEESEYSTSSDEASTGKEESDSEFESSTAQEEPRTAKEEPSNISERSLDVDEKESDASTFDVVEANASQVVSKSSDVGENGTDAATIEIEGADSSRVASPVEILSGSAEGDIISDHDVVVSSAGTGMLSAGAVTAATYTNGSDGGNASSNPREDSIASIVTEGYVGIPAASILDSDEMDTDSDASSTSDTSYEASSEGASQTWVTGETILGSESRTQSAEHGVTSVSNRSVGSDAAVVQTLGQHADAAQKSLDVSKDTEAASADGGVAELSPLSVGAMVTSANGLSSGQKQVVLDDETDVQVQPSTREPTLSSSQATVAATQQTEDMSTGAVVVGTVAGGAALLGAAAYALGRKSPKADEDSLASANSLSNISIEKEESLPIQSAAVLDTDPEQRPVFGKVVPPHQNFPKKEDEKRAADAVGIASQSTNETTPSSSTQVVEPGSDATFTSEAVTDTATEGAVLAAGVVAYKYGGGRSTSKGSDSASDSERTTDDDSCGDDSTDVVTDMGMAGSRSMSRSTLATSYAGTQSVSRSTLETSGSSLQPSLKGQGGSSRGFFEKDSTSSLLKSGVESSDGGIANTPVNAMNSMGSATLDSANDSSDEDSSDYDSDSTDTYYSDESGKKNTAMSNTDEVFGDTENKALAASSQVAESASNDEVPAKEEEFNALTNVDGVDMVIRNPEVEGQSSFGSSGAATMTESSLLTESGDTFLAMEEAAHVTNPDEVNVTKTRFAPNVNEVDYQEEGNRFTSGVVDANIAEETGVIVPMMRPRSESESESSQYTDASSSSYDSSDSDTESGSYTSDSSGSSESDSSSSDDESSSSDSSNTDGDSSTLDENKLEATAKIASVLADIREQTATESVAQVSEGSSNVEPKNESTDVPNLRCQLKPVKSEGSIARKPVRNLAPFGPGARAQLLRARSDAMLSGNKRDETLQALLTSWDQEYDITAGEEETTVTSEESLLVLYANAGLPAIEEVLSDESTQSMTLGSALSEEAIAAALRSGPLPEDAIAAAMQHGSSSLLDFDYSLRTVPEERSGEITHDEESFVKSSGGRAQSSFERSSEILDQAFEDEVLQGLDDSDNEAMDQPSFKPSAVEATTAQNFAVGPQDGSSGRMSLDSRGSYSSGTVSDGGGSSDDESSYSSASSSEYSTDSSSSAGSGSTTSDYSSDSHSAESSSGSSTSGSPRPISPHAPNSSSEARTYSFKEEGQMPGDQIVKAESKAWAAIAEANKPDTSEAQGHDAAERAIKESLTALKLAEKRAASFASSSGLSSGSSSYVSFSSDYTSSSSDEDSDN